MRWRLALLAARLWTRAMRALEYLTLRAEARADRWAARARRWRRA